MKSKKPTIIHINRNVLQQNEKNDTSKPICRVEVKGKTWYGSKVDILGPSTMIYSPEKPRTCGAKLWIETFSEVVIHDKVTFKELKNG